MKPLNLSKRYHMKEAEAAALAAEMAAELAAVFAAFSEIAETAAQTAPVGISATALFFCTAQIL